LLFRQGLDPDPCEYRAITMREFIEFGVNGIALKPACNESFVADLVDMALAEGIPTVHFDSDNPNSTRAAYVGTDQVFLGRTMAKLLRQLRPEGGTFCIIGEKEGRVDGFVEEITKHNGREDRSQWTAISPKIERRSCDDGDGDDCGDAAYWEQMDSYARLNVTAMITIVQSPMRHPNWTDFVDLHRHRNITYIGTDGADYQLDYLDRRYVDGLVGQLPYEMGTESLQVLYDLATGRRHIHEGRTIFPTNIVAYNLIPLELPPLDVEDNLLGNLRLVGFALFGVVAVAAIGCLAWTYRYRRYVVVRAAQPFFLAMVAGGVLIMASTLVPLSYDDAGRPSTMSACRGKAVCMSVPWLGFVGFTVIFSALLSKTWRVNRLFRSKVRHARLRVSERDVLGPFAVLLAGNIVVLVCWTVLDPLTYQREHSIGTE